MWTNTPCYPEGQGGEGDKEQSGIKWQRVREMDRGKDRGTDREITRETGREADRGTDRETAGVCFNSGVSHSAAYSADRPPPP